MHLRLVNVLTLGLLLGACASTPEGLPLDPANLQHHHWALEQIDGQPVSAAKGQAPDLEITQQLRAHGNAGCNGYFGQLQIQEQQLRINPMGSTQMACPAPQQDWENAMTSTLSQWSEATLSAQQLRLKGPQHELLFRLSDWVH